EDDHDHSHDDLNDPHVWLSATMLKNQSKQISDRLKKLIPDSADAIDQNLTAFHQELETVHAELTESLKERKGTNFFVYHGAFAYFAQDYGLEQVAVEIGNRKPTPQQLADLVKQAKASDIKLIFVQPQFDQSSAKALAESIGGEIRILDPLEKDVIANLRKIAVAIKGDS
ncbi:MAG: zinc ABC transporter substrate-binding protein, partial [Verrucomicrobiota bacterium]